ncbi:MAG: acyl carrier protein [Nitrospinae bacterium]|nr:acyl carrier protein [Nitrospinota bacterium]
MSQQDDLVAFIREELLDDEEADLTPATPLFSSQLLDSMSLSLLLAHVEETFSLRVPAMEVVYDNFDSVDRILAYVEKKRA